jgi:hypothetical protein
MKIKVKVTQIIEKSVIKIFDVDTDSFRMSDDPSTNNAILTKQIKNCPEVLNGQIFKSKNAIIINKLLIEILNNENTI